MNILLAAIKARVTTLLTGVVYDDPVGGQSPVAIHLGALPAKRSETDQGQDFPFVVIRPLGGSGDRAEQLTTVRLICGIYSGTDEIETGVFQVHDLAERLLAIQSERGFKPYRLILPVTWKFGDESDPGNQGNQPHPFYFLTIDLSFKSASLADLKP